MENRTLCPSSSEEVADDADELVAGYRVQAAGRLVEDQQPRPMRQRHGDHEFHRHATGQVLDLGPRIEAELVEQLAVARRRPSGRRRGEAPARPRPAASRPRGRCGRAPPRRPGAGRPVPGTRWPSSSISPASIARMPKQAADGRGLAGAVGADQAHDVARSAARSSHRATRSRAHRGAHATQGEREIAGHRWFLLVDRASEASCCSACISPSRIWMSSVTVEAGPPGGIQCGLQPVLHLAQQLLPHERRVQRQDVGALAGDRGDEALGGQLGVGAGGGDDADPQVTREGADRGQGAALGELAGQDRRPRPVP